MNFVKRGPATHAPMYHAEAEGLAALAAAGARVPRVIAVGERSAEAFIEMQRLDLAGRPDWPALAEALAALHRRSNTPPQFGWAADNWIGLAPQANGWCDDWSRFWFEKRLAPQAARAAQAGFAFDPDAFYGLLVSRKNDLSRRRIDGSQFNGRIGRLVHDKVLAVVRECRSQASFCRALDG